MTQANGKAMPRIPTALRNVIKEMIILCPGSSPLLTGEVMDILIVKLYYFFGNGSGVFTVFLTKWVFSRWICPWHFFKFSAVQLSMKKLGSPLAILSLFCFHISSLEAQQNEPPFYVDFHIHTILKNYYRNIQRPEQAYIVPMGDTCNWVIYRGDKEDTVGFNNINSVDQGTYSLLNRGHARLLCTSLYTLEKQSVTSKCLPISGIFTAKWLRTAMQYSFFFPLDHVLSIRLLNQISVTGISRKRQRTAHSQEVSNFDELRAQLEYIRRQATTYSNEKPVVLADRNAALSDTTRIWLILSVEGAHNFYGRFLSDPDSIWGYQINSRQENEVLSNLDYIKDNYRLLFVTPSHLFENKIAGMPEDLI